MNVRTGIEAAQMGIHKSDFQYSVMYACSEKTYFFNAYWILCRLMLYFLYEKNLYPIYTSIFCSVIPYYLSSVSENVSKSQIFS